MYFLTKAPMFTFYLAVGCVLFINEMFYYYFVLFKVGGCHVQSGTIKHPRGIFIKMDQREFSQTSAASIWSTCLINQTALHGVPRRTNDRPTAKSPPKAYY